MIHNYIIVIAPPTPVFVTSNGDDVSVFEWNNVVRKICTCCYYRLLLLYTTQAAPVISERCGFDPLLNYTVVLEDNTGMILDQRVVSSDSCNDSCSISFSPSSLAETCRVGVRASNAFAQSDTRDFFIGWLIIMPHSV